MKNIILRSLLLVISLGISSCEKRDDAPVTEDPSGDIIGKVTLYDTREAELTDMSGVLVEALSGREKFAATTNAAGEFTFNKVPYGGYIINFRKENFRGFDSLRFAHLNKVDSLNFAKLTEMPKGQIYVSQITLQLEPPTQFPPTSYPKEYPMVYPQIRTEYDPKNLTVVSDWIYFSKEPKVSSTRYAFYKTTCCHEESPLFIARSSGIAAKEFYAKGFSPGDKVYVVAYLGNTMRLVYDNPSQGYDNYLFPNHSSNPSIVNSFILP